MFLKSRTITILRPALHRRRRQSTLHMMARRSLPEIGGITIIVELSATQSVATIDPQARNSLVAGIAGEHNVARRAARILRIAV
ncbi:hypothetical protein ACVOMV_26150 (plasmid) [Mesorhizobium atlanticum]